MRAQAITDSLQTLIFEANRQQIESRITTDERNHVLDLLGEIEKILCRPSRVPPGPVDPPEPPPRRVA